MKAQGVYDGEINGRVDPALLRAVRAYRVALGQPDDLNLDSTFLRKYLAADHAEVRKIAAAKLDSIALLEGPLPAPTPAPTASTAQGTSSAGGTSASGGTATAAGPAATQSAAIAQSTQPSQATATAPSVPPVAAAPTAGPTPEQVSTPARQPVAAQTVTAAPPAPARTAGAAPAAPQESMPTAQTASSLPAAATPAAAPRLVKTMWTPASSSDPVLKPIAHPAPVATIPIEGSRPANNAAYRAGEPFFVGVISPRDGYLYCYLVDDQKRVSQFYPAPAQPLARVSGGTLTVVNSGSPLLASRLGSREEVACFSSPKDLGRQPLDLWGITGGLEALKSRFASAVSGAFAMGVFDVKVQ
jgi:hypothetical protein